MTRYTILLLLILSLASCKKEIDFDYHETAPVVVIEGRVTNEGVVVHLTTSRSVTDSVKGRCLPGAEVTVTSEGHTELIPYDALAGCYRSDMAGQPGKTYELSIAFEGRHYDAMSTMPPAAPITSAQFLWQPVITERLLAYEVWAVDPEPDVRNYYWYRMERQSHHPHFVEKTLTNPYRWNVFDDRGCPPGLIYRDVMCMSERAADEDKEENWTNILYEGDIISFQLMTIDRSVYDYYTSLRTGQGGGANPRSNVVCREQQAGEVICQGYFAAGSITRTEPVVFSFSAIGQR